MLSSIWQLREAGVACVGAGQGEQDDGDDKGDDCENEDAAFRPGGASAQNGLADRMSGEESVLGDRTAIRYTVEEGLSPVP